MLPSRVIKLKQHRARHQDASQTHGALVTRTSPDRPKLRAIPTAASAVSNLPGLRSLIPTAPLAFLTETASQTEFAVTYSKQSPTPFLTGARIVNSAGIHPERSSRRAYPRAAAILIALTLLVTAAWSQSPASPPLDSQNLDAFLDKYFAEQMDKLHVPGAAIAIVKDGQVLAIKGYGYSNVEQKIPVDPDRTVFRLASVSKPFTAIAVLQLVEQGKLRLDENVNHYLRAFQLVENYSRPVTLENLLTHTAGFDDGGIGITARSAAEQTPLDTYLARRLGPRVLPPGDQYDYSNGGFSLAGYIAEITSGVPFAQYINDHIFKPLDMRQSGFVITPELYKNLAIGYDYRKDRFVPVALDYPNVVPAASLVSTARDMTHFMIAELQLGQYGAQRILSEDSAQRMFQRQYANDPRVPGTAFAYWEQYPNGTRIVRQDGDWMGAVSTVFFLPAEKVGIFVACNLGDQILIDDFLRQFMDHFYLANPETLKSAPAFESPDPPARFAGSYRLNRYAHHTFEKVGTLFREWKVSPADNGSIILLNPNLGPQHFLPVAPMLFRLDGSQEEIAFRQDENGRITRLALGRYVLEKLPWYEKAIVQKALFAFFGCAFGLSVLIALVVWFKNRNVTAPASQIKSDKHLARLRSWNGAVAFGNLLFLGGMFLAFLNRDPLVYGLPFYLAIVLCIPLITTAAVPIILWQTFRAWQTRSGSPLARAFYSFEAFAALCFIPFLLYWNLLGFHY